MRKHIVTGAFTAALQMTLIAIQPEWFRAHWPYVLGFWVVALFLWLWWLVTRKQESLASSISVRQNSGRGNVGSVNRSVFNQFNLGSPAPLEVAVSRQPLPEPETLPKADLVYSGFDLQRLTFRMGTWASFSGGSPGILLYLENKAPKAGEASESVFVGASIKYKDDADNTVAHVYRAYWLGHRDNQIKLEIGARKAILLGTQMAVGVWQVCSNSAEPEIRFARHGMPHFKNPQRSFCSFEGRLKIEVSIISPDTGYTIKQFLLEAEDEADGSLIVKETDRDDQAAQTVARAVRLEDEPSTVR